MPTKSRWQLDIPQCTVPTFLFQSADAELPTKPALIDAERPDTYWMSKSTFRLWCQRFAAGLRKAGLQDGEPVMLYSGNTLFFPVAVLGTIMAGGIFTGANPTYNAREVAYQAENSGARFLICADVSLDIGLEGAQKAGLSKDRVFVFDNGYDTFDGKGQGAKGCKHWTTLMVSEAEGRRFQWKEDKSRIHDVAALNYSSGTTGLPKGVMITHQNYISNTKQHMYLTQLLPDFEAALARKRWLCFLPMYHAMAQTIYCFGAQYLDIPVYIMKRFDFTQFLKAIQEFRITDLQLVPPIVVLMAKSPETKKYDLSSIEAAGAGAAPLGREPVIEFEKLWPNGQINLKQGWGMTEVTCSMLGWDPKQHCEDHSVGEPNANTEVKLVDEDGNEVPDGERGEIWGRGPNVMKGYWKNEEATRNTLTPDGWLKTGDIAIKDKRGFFFIVDRKKELIKVKGMQVAPAELEAQLLEHPSISDSCVVGVTIDGEEYPRAYVQKSAVGQDLKEDEVAKWMETKVSKHKRLTGGVKFVNEIMKNPSGKILRRNYREIAAKEVGQVQAKL